MLDKKLIKIIHVLVSKLGMSDDDYRLLLSGYGVKSSKDLSTSMAARLIDDLESKAVKAGVWERRREKKKSYPNRPKNMDRPSSRADQLGKIEALLTVGGLPWSYADAIAKQMGLADKVAWVPDGDLYRIITALKVRAKKMGWDLSGEK